MIDTPPPAVLIAFAAAFGAVVGSFLNVCIYRLPIGKSIVWPASACTKCGHELSWYENVPIVSWTVLRARCRSCGEPIAMRYPIVEALTAAMFAGAWWYYGPGLLLASRLILGCSLVVLFAIDLEHHLLPNVITIPGIAVGFLLSLFDDRAVDSLLGIAAGAGILLAVYFAYLWLRKIEALGMGDPKMLAMVGAFLGWKLTLLTLLFASLSGSIVGLWLIVARRGSLMSILPFGCFIAIGAAIASVFGQPFLDWYATLFIQ